jgi:radical SAM-linked protein
MRRAGFPLEYSKGFHPFPKVSFGPPLGVGVSGMSEYFDIEITPPFDLEVNREKLNSMLPEGVYVKDMTGLPAGVESLNSFITRYEYEVRGADISRINTFLSEKETSIEREKGSINIRNMVEDGRITDDNSVRLMLVDLGDAKVRLGELLPAIFGVPLERLDISRVALYGWNGGWVKPVERSFQWIAK